MPNRLAKETSPYLQQHANNPVDWYPWGKEALEKATKEDKPIFLSIGYSACHWCHVMEKESFEDAETAKILNDFFVSIKVDREERPDLDTIYMSAVQMMTQHGGWPLTVFLTPELEPFYGGTYFPPEDRQGMPSFKRILAGVAGAWKTRKAEMTKSAKELVTALKGMSDATSEGAEPLSNALVENAVTSIRGAYDSEYGGIGAAPKFFHTMDFRLALAHWNKTKDKELLSMITHTLEAWSKGGIYDHLGGGFHRYSTDRSWFAPHFEKMLYDNALVGRLFVETYQATKDDLFSKVAHETLDYVVKHMRDEQGGFYSTEDADSEGEEGKFYVWTKNEIEKLLTPEIAQRFVQTYNVTAEGNWEGSNILFRTGRIEHEDEIAVAKRKLFQERAKRIPPFKDTKIIASWNGLMIDTLAFAGRVLHEPTYLEAAKKAAGFAMTSLWEGKKRTLRHSYKDGRAQHNGCLDDYAALVNALITLYETTFEIYWLDCAEEILKVAMEQFWDESTATFFYTGKDHEKLVFRPKENHDGATPSGTSLAVTALARIGKIVEDGDWMKKAERALASHERLMRLIPLASGQMLLSLGFLYHSREIVVVPGTSKEECEEMIDLLYDHYLPHTVFAVWDKKKAEQPLYKGRTAIDGKTTVYICENFQCKAPVSGVAQLKKALDGIS